MPHRVPSCEKYKLDHPFCLVRPVGVGDGHVEFVFCGALSTNSTCPSPVRSGSVPYVKAPRKDSASGYYHIVLKGAGGQLLFGSGADYRAFVFLLGKYWLETGIVVLAYRLMSNHIHMLLLDANQVLATFMCKSGTTFAMRHNNTTGRTGPVFHNRYWSVPIVFFGMLDGVEGFAEFMALPNTAYDPMPASGSKLTDGAAAEMMRAVLGKRGNSLKGVPKAARDETLRKLRDAGISATQASRLTGIGRSAIPRAFATG